MDTFALFALCVIIGAALVVARAWVLHARTTRQDTPEIVYVEGWEGNDDDD